MNIGEQQEHGVSDQALRLDWSSGCCCTPPRGRAIHPTAGGGRALVEGEATGESPRALVIQGRTLNDSRMAPQAPGTLEFL